MSGEIKLMIHWGRYLSSVVLLLWADIYGFKEVELRKKLRGPVKASVPSVSEVPLWDGVPQNVRTQMS